jgi:hypothetical protein
MLLVMIVVRTVQTKTTLMKPSPASKGLRMAFSLPSFVNGSSRQLNAEELLDLAPE